MKRLIKSITQIAYHRNGICGEPFHVVRFTIDIEPDDGRFNIYEEQDAGQRDAKFIAILFAGAGQCAAICVDRLESHGVQFAKGNSWRGDHYEPELREAIKEFEASGKSGRIGPFCVPMPE